MNQPIPSEQNALSPIPGESLVGAQPKPRALVAPPRLSAPIPGSADFQSAGVVLGGVPAVSPLQLVPGTDQFIRPDSLEELAALLHQPTPLLTEETLVRAAARLFWGGCAEKRAVRQLALEAWLQAQGLTPNDDWEGWLDNEENWLAAGQAITRLANQREKRERRFWEGR